jgi:SAM-dependent methyltransferase
MVQISPTPETLVLDVGFCDRERSPTENFIEKHYPYPERLTALGIDTPHEFKERYPKVTAISYDGTRFPFADKRFDVCWSNAVLDHVGSSDKQVIFLKEVKRVSRRAFITTPNRLFPVEVHTRTPLLHYLPKNLFDRYLAMVGKAWASGDSMHLLSERDLWSRLSQAGIADYRLVRNRVLGFTMDFVVLANCG